MKLKSASLFAFALLLSACGKSGGDGGGESELHKGATLPASAAESRFKVEAERNASEFFSCEWNETTPYHADARLKPGMRFIQKSASIDGSSDGSGTVFNGTIEVRIASVKHNQIVSNIRVLEASANPMGIRAGATFRQECVAAEPSEGYECKFSPQLPETKTETEYCYIRLEGKETEKQETKLYSGTYHFADGKSAPAWMYKSYRKGSLACQKYGQSDSEEIRGVAEESEVIIRAQAIPGLSLSICDQGADIFFQSEIRDDAGRTIRANQEELLKDPTQN